MAVLCSAAWKPILTKLFLHCSQHTTPDHADALRAVVDLDEDLHVDFGRTLTLSRLSCMELAIRSSVDRRLLLRIDLVLSSTTGPASIQVSDYYRWPTLGSSCVTAHAIALAAISLMQCHYRAVCDA